MIGGNVRSGLAFKGGDHDFSKSQFYADQMVGTYSSHRSSDNADRLSSVGEYPKNALNAALKLLTCE